MEYMLLLYSDETLAKRMKPEELGPVFAEFGAVTGDLQKKGQLKHSSPLEPTAAATTVRVREGKHMTTDGPFAETKEQLGGYYVIDVKDLDEAIAVAARIPTSRFGCVEVRPIMRMHQGR
jgi:hypothetical protein